MISPPEPRVSSVPLFALGEYQRTIPSLNILFCGFFAQCIPPRQVQPLMSLLEGHLIGSSIVANLYSEPSGLMLIFDRSAKQGRTRKVYSLSQLPAGTPYAIDKFVFPSSCARGTHPCVEDPPDFYYK